MRAAHHPPGARPREQVQPQLGGDALRARGRAVVLARVQDDEGVSRADEQRDFVEGIFFGHAGEEKYDMTGMLEGLRALDDGRHRAEFYRMWRAGYSAGFTHPKSLETMG